VNGIHDMGGMHGFGPIEREQNEPVFHADWEGRVYAMMGLVRRQGLFNLDEFRYGIEQMAPADYLTSSYYERWLASTEYNLLLKGAIGAGELEARVALLREQPDTALPPPAAFRPEPEHGEAPPPRIVPRFVVGDPVVTHNQHPTGHTRLPRYLRGKRGRINLVHGPEVFADASAHGRDAPPQVVYNVRFDAREVWGDSAEPRQTISIDLWESYLEPAPV
jgi:nitrile hydratase